MRIVKVGPNEFWTVPEGINVMDHVKPGQRIMWLDKLPPDVTKIGDLGNGMRQYTINRNKQNAMYQERHRNKMKADGLVRICAWILPVNVDRFKKYTRKLK